MFFSFCLICQKAEGQYGVRATYNINQVFAWSEFFDNLNASNNNILNQSLSFELDYWLRLPNHRIEFYPYLSYHQANTVVLSGEGAGATEQSIGLRQFGLGLISHIYLLDLVGDCDCPTFSKQGGFVKKGFFLLGGIGVVRSDKTTGQTYNDANLDFSARLGAGLDIGLTDFVTLSPFVQYQYFPSVSWHDLGTDFQTTPQHVESALGQLQFGLRIGFRPDYKRRF